MTGPGSQAQIVLVNCLWSCQEMSSRVSSADGWHRPRQHRGNQAISDNERQIINHQISQKYAIEKFDINECGLCCSLSVVPRIAWGRCRAQIINKLGDGLRMPWSHSWSWSASGSRSQWILTLGHWWELGEDELTWDDALPVTMRHINFNPMHFGHFYVLFMAKSWWNANNPELITTSVLFFNILII